MWVWSFLYKYGADVWWGVHTYAVFCNLCKSHRRYGNLWRCADLHSGCRPPTVMNSLYTSRHTNNNACTYISPSNLSLWRPMHKWSGAVHKISEEVCNPLHRYANLWWGCRDMYLCEDVCISSCGGKRRYVHLFRGMQNSAAFSWFQVQEHPLADALKCLSIHGLSTRLFTQF